MAENGVTTDERQTISLAVERINQMLGMLREERDALRREREVHREALDAMMTHLEQIKDHWASAERLLATSVRLEGSLREGVAHASRLVDKLPGRRRE